jgi:glycosyltransferase involved in cell wall biosynthesis
LSLFNRQLRSAASSQGVIAVDVEVEMHLENINVLAPVGYPWDFCGPRQSTATISRRRFLPFNRVREGWDGFTLFSPMDVAKTNLIHAFNRIPLNGAPYVIGFESHMPRLFSADASWFEGFLYRTLLSTKCRRIVAISQFAKGNYLSALGEARLSAGERELLESKVDVRYPSIPMLDTPRLGNDVPEEWILTFVGNHFGRKGGCVAVRVAEIARSAGLPIRVKIVSSLQSGGKIWTDPSDEAFFKPYYDLLKLPNVEHLAGLNNAAVLKLLGESHFSILTTFADTFGFSVIESMVRGTPAICTGQGALTEFVIDGENGLVIPPALSPGLSHWGPPYNRRDTESFKALYRGEIERMATQCIEKLTAIMADPQKYLAMRHAAYVTASTVFNAGDARHYWDGIYDSAVNGPAG